MLTTISCASDVLRSDQVYQVIVLFGQFMPLSSIRDTAGDSHSTNVTARRPG